MDACLQEFEAQHGFSLARGTTLLAVSGGVDSMVLLHLFVQAGYPIAVAHVNFGLRGDASDADEALVYNTCKSLDIACHVLRPDTQAYAAAHKLSIQMAARALRYGFFAELIRDFGYERMATAHHADDALETFFIYLMRNNGRAALTGIEAIKEHRLRPLLSFTKKELLQFAEANKLQWRDDESNASVKYLRNQVRHWLIPALKEEYPEIVTDYLALSQAMRAHYQAEDIALNEVMLPYILHRSNQRIVLSKSVLEHPKIEQIFGTISRPLGFVLDSVHGMLRAKVGASLKAVNTDWELQVLHDQFRFVKAYSNPAYSQRLPAGKDSVFELGEFSIKASWVHGEYKPEKNEYIFGLFESKIDVCLRSYTRGDKMIWKQGARAKKVSDIFTDAHISTFDRWAFPLIEIGGEIVGIVGVRRSAVLLKEFDRQWALRISWERIVQ